MALKVQKTTPEGEQTVILGALLTVPGHTQSTTSATSKGAPFMDGSFGGGVAIRLLSLEH